MYHDKQLAHHFNDNAFSPLCVRYQNSVLLQTSASCESVNSNSSESVISGEVFYGSSDNLNSPSIKDGTTEEQESMSVNIMMGRNENQVAMGQDVPKGKKVMDVETVMLMFHDLKEEIGEIKDIKGRVIGVEQYQKFEGEHVAKHVSKLIYYKRRSEVLSNTVISMACQMDKLKERVEALDIQSCKKSVVINGLDADDKGAVCANQVQSFFDEEMGVDIPVVDAFQIGEANPKTIIAPLESNYDRQLLMQNKAVLKDIVNDQGKPIYVNEQVPSFVREKRRWEREIVRQNNRKSIANKKKMEYENGSLVIDSIPYKKKVATPKPGDVLKLTPKELNKIMKLKLQHGEIWKDLDDSFQAFTASVQTHQQVSDLYLFLKLEYPAARHIIRVYNLPGLDDHFSNYYCDDNADGARERILRMMKKNEFEYRVVFVVCHSTDSKGVRCFTHILEAAEDVLKKYKYNQILNKNQLFKEDGNKSRPDDFRLSRKDTSVKRGASNVHQSGRRPTSVAHQRGANVKRQERKQTDKGQYQGSHLTASNVWGQSFEFSNPVFVNKEFNTGYENAEWPRLDHNYSSY